MMESKILFFSKESTGGIGTFLKQIDLLDKMVFIKRFYLYKKNYLSYSRKEYQFINNDYPDDNFFSLYKIGILGKNIFLTYRLLLEERPSLVFCCDQYSSVILLLIKTFLLGRLKIICLVNTNLKVLISQKPNQIYRTLLYVVFKLLYRKAYALIAVSKGLSTSIAAYFGLKSQSVTLIYNGIKIPTQRKKVSKKTKKLIKVVTAGRLDLQKDFDTIFQALVKVKKTCNYFVFYVIGSGPLKSQLKKTVQKLAIGHCVKFIGWKKSIERFLRSADIFIFSSHYEGFGRVIIEAMAQGVPIIATNTPFGPSEILDNGKYGILIPMRDEKSMARAIIRLTQRPKLRVKYSLLAYKRAKYFDVKKSLQQYKTLFLNVINEKN